MKQRNPLQSTFSTAVVILALLLATSRAEAQESQVSSISIGERLVFHSEVLGEERTMLIALPKGYHDMKEGYPVLYVLDGEFFFYQAYSAVQFLSECTYIRTPPVPQMIVVGIVNVDRNRDYTPNHTPVQGGLRYPTSGGANKFLEFVRSELFPEIEARYRTQPYRIL